MASGSWRSRRWAREGEGCGGLLPSCLGSLLPDIQCPRSGQKLGNRRRANGAGFLGRSPSGGTLLCTPDLGSWPRPSPPGLRAPCPGRGSPPHLAPSRDLGLSSPLLCMCNRQKVA